MDKADMPLAFKAAREALKAAPFTSCRALAKAVHDACEELDTPQDVRDYIADAIDVRLSDEQLAELAANGGEFLVPEDQLPNPFTFGVDKP